MKLSACQGFRPICPMDVTYYVPLSYALEFPRLRFGCAEIRRFTASELSAAWRIDELPDHSPALVPDIRALCQFQYLVVRGDARSGRWTPPGTLTFPFNIHPDNLERVAVYERHFPPAVDRAIFCLLLQPIEHAVHYGLDWRPFETPVLYVRHDGPAQRPRLPPDPSKLNWEACFTENGEEYERPSTCGECDRAGLEQELQGTWQLLERLLPLDGTCQSAINPLVERFVLRAYEQGRFDGLIMHMTAIDALLGAREWNATGRIKERVVKLLSIVEAGSSAQHAGDEFKRLYDMRSRYIHGRMRDSEQTSRGSDPFRQDIVGAHVLTRSLILAACRFVEDNNILARENFLDRLTL